MVLFSIVTVALSLIALSSAHENSLEKKALWPSQWLSPLQLEQIPSIEEISLEKLENMSVEKGAEVIEKIYHLSQINQNLKPNFVPSPSTTPVQLYKQNGQKVTTTLDKLAAASKQIPDLGDEEVTIVITGMPATTKAVKKANQKLIEAYLERYNAKKRDADKKNRSGENSKSSSSEEDSREWQKQKHSLSKLKAEKENRSGEKSMRTSSEKDSRESHKQEASKGNLVVIDLGSKLNSFKRMALLDTKQTGAMVASAIMEMTEKNNIPDESISIVAQGIAAHVAGAAAKEQSQRTGRKWRRITALDPSKLYAKDAKALAGLTRGDAEFVDAIHTSAYGLGTVQRVGDVDFYPNGPSEAVPGAKNIVEASMRATRYFAESVQPGQERNFPAIEANSLKEYLNRDGYGRRVYMGIDTDRDIEGDYILAVNDRSPYGKKSQRARKQNQDKNKNW